MGLTGGILCVPWDFRVGRGCLARSPEDVLHLLCAPGLCAKAVVSRPPREIASDPEKVMRGGSFWHRRMQWERGVRKAHSPGLLPSRHVRIVGRAEWSLHGASPRFMARVLSGIRAQGWHAQPVRAFEWARSRVQHWSGARILQSGRCAGGLTALPSDWACEVMSSVDRRCYESGRGRGRSGERPLSETLRAWSRARDWCAPQRRRKWLEAEERSELRIHFFPDGGDTRRIL